MASVYLVSQQQQECGCSSSILPQVATDGKRLQDPCGLLSAASPRLPHPFLGPAVTQVCPSLSELVSESVGGLMLTGCCVSSGCSERLC